jgi:hypothetical protein
VLLRYEIIKVGYNFDPSELEKEINGGCQYYDQNRHAEPDNKLCAFSENHPAPSAILLNMLDLLTLQSRLKNN